MPRSAISRASSSRPQSLWTGLWQLLAQAPDVEVAGFESAHLVHRDFQRLLEAGPRAEWRPTTRSRRSAARAEGRGRGGAHSRSRGDGDRQRCETTLPEIRAGMTELEVAGLLEKALRDAGSEAFPFPSIVASGPRAALPHARASARQIARGDFLLLDFGARVRRLLCRHHPHGGRWAGERRQREVYDVVRQANELAASEVRVGMTGREADALARDYIERCGYGEEFGHGLGHGLGLEVHEAPRLARTADGLLTSGAVVTIEPGIYRPGWGGVRIEDDVHLAADGPELLTQFTRELIELA